MSDSRLRFTVLGCGSSPGVPRIGNDWGACDPDEPRNRRLRTSLMIERIDGNGGVTRVIVDTGPDFREQMLRAGVAKADAVVYTHPHADHIHGIDELRQFVINSRHRVPVFTDEGTSLRLREAFGYCFETPPGSGYPPIVRDNRVTPGEAITIAGAGGAVELMPFAQVHGDIQSIGYRVGGFVYSTDISALPDESRPLADRPEIFMVDALRYTPHPSHFSVTQALALADSLSARRVVLTHMHHDLDYRTLARELPAHAEPAYDGMVIEMAG